VGTTIVADFETGSGVPFEIADCCIVTQTLCCVFNLDQAVHSLMHMVKPGGCVLVTDCGIGPVSRYDMDRWGFFWHLLISHFAACSSTTRHRPILPLKLTAM